jgi:predicted nucleic acid-binding protein
VVRLVVDASLLVEYLMRSDLGKDLSGILVDPDVRLHAPALCDLEVVSTLRRLLLRRETTLERAGEALSDLLDMPLTRHGHESLLRRVISLRKNFSAYDAAYVALAELLGAPLLTTDHSLARAVKAHTDVPLLIAG